MFGRKEDYKIFISYERDDAAGWAGSIYQLLRDCYGPGVVFKDEEETAAGTDWPPRLARLVKQCNAFVLIIGPGWTDPRLVAKLNDPTNWVYKEIVTAVDSSRPIFPVVIEKAVVPDGQIPEKIREALSRHRFPFRRNSQLWPEDIARLCGDIASQTGLQWSRVLTADARATLDQTLSTLDRHKQIGDVHLCVEKGHRVLLAFGGKRSGFRYFAVRCCREISGDDRHHRPLCKELSWRRFTEPDNAQVRKKMLLKDIATKVFTDSQAGGQQDLQPWLTEHIRTNQRLTLVHSTVGIGTTDLASRIQEWLGIWRELLDGGGGQSMMVILFVQLGWWSWRPGKLISGDTTWGVINDKIGKIRQGDLEDWFETELQELYDARLQRLLRNQCQHLFRFRWSRHFDDIGEMVQEVWSVPMKPTDERSANI